MYSMSKQLPDPFAATYRRHWPGVVSAAERILGDRDRAEDIAQEVFVKLWRDPGRYDAARGALGPYLRLSARSRALDTWRSDQAAGRAVDRLESLAERPGSGGIDAPDRQAERAAERSVLLKALRLLPEAQREAVLLAFWGELPSSEIAK